MSSKISSIYSLLALICTAQSAALEVHSNNSAQAVTCYNGPGYVASGTDLYTCVNAFITARNWIDGTVRCGGRDFFLGGSKWNSPGDCMGGCTPCLQGSALNAEDWAKCNQQTGLAQCWFGWCPVGQNPGGNSDGSCS